MRALEVMAFRCWLKAIGTSASAREHPCPVIMPRITTNRTRREPRNSIVESVRKCVGRVMKVGALHIFGRATEWSRPPVRFLFWGVPPLRNEQTSKGHHLPTLRHGADFGLFLGFATEALGEELVEERLFQFRGQRDQPLLLLHRPLHQPQHLRNLPLLGARWNRDARCFQISLADMNQGS